MRTYLLKNSFVNPNSPVFVDSSFSTGKLRKNCLVQISCLFSFSTEKNEQITVKQLTEKRQKHN
jgi:hypothetical protein